MESLRIFIGYDQRQPVSYNVLQHSIISRASKPVSIHPLVFGTLPIERQGLTPFTYSRFLVPWLCKFEGWALVLDTDMLCLGDVAEVFSLADPSKAIFVRRSNMPLEWASAMLFNCGHEANRKLTPEYVGDKSRCRAPHKIDWCEEKLIGDLPREWNQLVLYDAPKQDVKLYHFTAGIPLFPEVRGCEGSKKWCDEARRATSAVSWNELMGSSIHSKAVARFQKMRGGSKV